MPSQVSWFIPDHVIYQHFTGRVLISEFWEGVRAVNERIDQSPQPQVHVMVSTWHVEGLEAGIEELKQLTPYLHPRVGSILLILPESPLIAPIVQLVSTLMMFFVPIRLNFFESHAQALAYLAQSNPHLTIPRFDLDNGEA